MSSTKGSFLSPSASQHPTPPLVFRASDHAHDGKKHLLLAATGSVATIKIPLILQALSAHPNLSIILLFTPSATQFLQSQSAEQPSISSLASTPNLLHIFTDSAEWSTPWVRNAPILHIELRRWSDIMVIAPLSADMLGRIVGGLADGLVSSVVRAWDTTGEVDGKRKRIMVAASMNTGMWKQPVTQRQIRVLEEEWGVDDGEGEGMGSPLGWFEVLKPVEKRLACGDVGQGAMREWKDLVGIIEQRLQLGG